MKISFCIGNGTSRADFDLTTLTQGPTYGCNLLVESFSLDNTIVCDKAVLIHLMGQGYQNRTNLYTRLEWQKTIDDKRLQVLPQGYSPVDHKYDEERNWSSGIYAVWLAVQQNADVVVMLGYDLWSNNVTNNNVYIESSFYKTTPVDPAAWIHQLARIFTLYPHTSFVQIQPPDWKVPTEWEQIDNFSLDSYKGLEELG